MTISDVAVSRTRLWHKQGLDLESYIVDSKNSTEQQYMNCRYATISVCATAALNITKVFVIVATEYEWFHTEQSFSTELGVTKW